MPPEVGQLYAAIGVWGQLVVWSAAVATAAGVLWRHLKPLVDDIRTLKRIADETQSTVEAQLRPNGGSSLHDRVAQIHASLTSVHDELREEREERRSENKRLWEALMLVARRGRDT